jgi:hypothetical protein
MPHHLADDVKGSCSVRGEGFGGVLPAIRLDCEGGLGAR